MMISVAMATYNGARYLREQLDSFIAQERLPDELVVCDDASTDDSLSILQDFAVRAPFPVQVHRNERNLGYVANFGKALSLTKGDLVFLSDQDDVWLPDKLAVFERRATAAPSTLLLVCDFWLCDQALDRGVRKSDNNRRLGVPPDDMVTGCCTAVRRDLLPLALPMPDAAISHDAWLHLLAQTLGRREFIDQPLHLARRHGGNASASPTSTLQLLPRTNRYRRLARVHFGDTVPVWLRLREKRIWLQARFGERLDVLAQLVGSEKAKRTIEDLSNEIEAFDRRIAIARLPRTSRLRPILKMFREGAYARNKGALSALKDLVRQQSATVPPGRTGTGSSE
jgi:hypothetical protein